MTQNQTILEIRDLRTYFFTPQGVVKAVDGVSLELRRGETLCLVGESGCGKTATALSILGLIEGPRGRIVAGEISYHGEDLRQATPARLRELRGNRIAMIFQDPQTALNPVLRIGDQIAEPIKLHLGLGEKEARAKAVELLRRIGIPSPETRIDDYPHQLSGGMKQRVLIAMALACQPEVIIADEPTTALDVTTKAQIMDIFQGLKEIGGMSFIFITHDLGTVAEMADRIVMMYAGRIAEVGTVLEVFDEPKHPYTQGLFACLPDISKEADRLPCIPGSVPNLIDPPHSCLFSPRCPHAMEICRQARPPEFALSSSRRVACFLYDSRGVSGG